MANWNIADVETPTPTKSRPSRHNAPRKQEDGTWKVDSSTETLLAYTVRQGEQGLECSCEGFYYRKACKHVRQVLDAMGEPVFTSHKVVSIESLYDI